MFVIDKRGKWFESQSVFFLYFFSFDNEEKERTNNPSDIHGLKPQNFHLHVHYKNPSSNQMASQSSKCIPLKAHAEDWPKIACPRRSDSRVQHERMSEKRVFLLVVLRAAPHSTAPQKYILLLCSMLLWHIMYI